MAEFKAIIFDMDGTLVDSEVVWEAAEADMFAERNMSYTDEIRAEVIGLRLDEFFTKLVDIFKLDEDVSALQAELVDRMLDLIPKMVEPKPGAHEIVNYAVNSGLPYCIASSSPMSIIESIVASQNWGDTIPRRYSADMVENGKPAPDVYLRAAQQLGVNPADCLAIEDSRNGARAAVAAGMTCFAVPDTHTKPEYFAGITPHVYSDLHQVLAILKGERG